MQHIFIDFFHAQWSVLGIRYKTGIEIQKYIARGSLFREVYNLIDNSTLKNCLRKNDCSRNI